MARVPRSAYPDGAWHVITRGVNRERIYLDADDRRTFASGFFGAATRFHWDWHTLCLMDTHYHAVLLTTRADLSAGMRRLNGGYAQEFNAKYGRRGHLFAGRFTSWVIEDEAHLEAACTYALLNPVRAGLCDSPAEWPWSWSRYSV